MRPWGKEVSERENMTKISTGTATLLALAIVGLFLVSAFLLMPLKTEAAFRIGGGNALLRATTGIANTNSASDLFANLSFASTHGGRRDETPPTNNGEGDSEDNKENNSTSDQGAQSNPTDNDSGNGGNGGSGAVGGLVRAGNVISNSTALNMINVTIVRIGGWDN